MKRKEYSADIQVQILQPLFLKKRDTEKKHELAEKARSI